MADDWKPGQAAYTSPYAQDFNKTSTGFEISMRKKQGFNWDYGSYGIMDNGGATSQAQWGGGSTARSSGPGSNLGTGSVNIRNVGSPAEFDPSRNFRTLRNASYTTGRGFMKAGKGLGKMANGLMSNNANRLNTKMASAQQAQQQTQQQNQQNQQTYADSYMGVNWDSDGNALDQPYHPLMPQKPIPLGTGTPSAGTNNPSNYLNTRPTLQPPQQAQRPAQRARPPKLPKVPKTPTP